MTMDKYTTIYELRAAERVGIDYRIRVQRRKLPVAIIAPHGGRIERGTSLIAAAIADGDFNLYCFEGLRRRPHRDLHVTSTRFDDAACLRIVSACDIVLSVHGLAGGDEKILVGGRDTKLRNIVCTALKRAGFHARIVTTGIYAAMSSANVCNRGRRRRGVQLEITKRLRDQLRREPPIRDAFASAVRTAIAVSLNGR
jgi:phage replication-related protein YjqB (UPF0714/DUF867 family)